MARRVWKPVPRGEVWQCWKKLAMLEKAGNPGKSWQSWKKLAMLEKKWVTHFPAFHQSGSRVGRLSWDFDTNGIAKPMQAHLMAGHFYRRRLPLPGCALLQKLPAKSGVVQIARRPGDRSAPEA
jgi:hypothetical protein